MQAMVQAKLHLTTIQEGRQFLGESGSGHSVVTDDADGNTGAKPIELALLALGGCTAFDVISILRKMRQRVTGYDVELQADQRDDPPHVFTRVTIIHKVRGCVDPQALKRAIHLSESKYCSVSAMIGKTARIDSSFEIIPETETVEGAIEKHDMAH
jgi:putative redox protein